MFKLSTQTTKTLRLTRRVALIAAATFLPVTAQASPIEQVQSRVEQTHKQVQKIRSQVSEIVTDLREQKEFLEDVGGEKLLETVRSLLQFMQHARADYDGFVFPDNCGSASQCGAFREDLRQMMLSFADLPRELPFVDQVPPAVEQLEKMAEVIDYVPPVILYAADQALGNVLDDVYTQIELLRAAAGAMPEVPSLAELKQGLKGGFSDGSRGFCDLDFDSPHIALIQVVLGRLADTLSEYGDFMEDDFTFGVSPGGTAKLKNPFKLAFQLTAYINNEMGRRLETRIAMAKSVCAL